MKKQGILDKVLKCAVVTSLGFLYWSSNLLEKDIKFLKKDLSLLQEDLKEVLRIVRQKSLPMSGSVPASTLLNQESTAIPCSSYENLLIPDPYVEATLPSLLEENFTPKGVLRTAYVGKPDNLSPFNGFESVANLYDLCVAPLAQAHVGKYEVYAPCLASRIEEHLAQDGSGCKEFHVYLRKDVFWAPINPNLFPKHVKIADVFLQPHPVTAHDFKFYYDAVMNPYTAEMRAVSLRSYFEDIVAFKVEDDYKFIVRWRAHPVSDENGVEENKVLYSSFFNTLGLAPLPCFVYQYFANGEKIIENDEDVDTYRKNSVWAQNFASHWAYNYIVSCGPYYFAGMDDEKLTFVRNPDYFDPYAALVEKRYIYIKESSDSIFQDFKSGKLDIVSLPPNQVENLAGFMKSSAYAKQVAKGGIIHELVSADRSYSYIGWNCQTLFFRDKKVRQAMNMLIDRNRIIDECLDGRGYIVSGPFSLHSPSYNKEVEGWYYSVEEAARILEDAGWVDLDGDGIREKVIDGVVVPFRFRLSYFVKSATARIIAEQIATSCKEVGIDCLLLGLDMADFSRSFEEKTFDALFAGWCLGSPPEDPRAIWHSAEAQEKGSANAIGFQNSEVDQLIDQLSYEYDVDKRRALYHRFHEIVHEDAPYAFLFSRSYSTLYKDYVKNVFIPMQRTDLIPGAQDEKVNLSRVWIDRRGDECSDIS